MNWLRGNGFFLISMGIVSNILGSLQNNPGLTHFGIFFIIGGSFVLSLFDSWDDEFWKEEEKK